MKQQLIIISTFITILISCNKETNFKIESEMNFLSFQNNKKNIICILSSLIFKSKGTIITKDSKMLMLSEFSNDKTILFDFKLKEKTKTCIDLVLGQTNEQYITHCYYLTLDTIFNTKEKREKIYKFSWNNFSLYNIDNLEEGFIQFYYSDKRGIIGMNAGFYGEENKTDIIFNKGEQFDSLDIAKFIIQNPIIM